MDVSCRRAFSHKRKRLFFIDLEAYGACHLFIYLPTATVLPT